MTVCMICMYDLNAYSTIRVYVRRFTCIFVCMHDLIIHLISIIYVKGLHDLNAYIQASMQCQNVSNAHMPSTSDSSAETRTRITLAWMIHQALVHTSSFKHYRSSFKHYRSSFKHYRSSFKHYRSSFKHYRTCLCCLLSRHSKSRTARGDSPLPLARSSSSQRGLPCPTRVPSSYLPLPS